jgi:Predicted signal transduction protein containing a membrane domain, an EAL and a GGDEF domain
MDALQQPMRLEDREFSVSASVGIALYPRDGQESEELLQTADKAMYVSKQRKGIGV